MSVMVKNKTNKNYKRSQKGRSMVEMLGVLAIIGVLSVGGVYGYGVAMKKHKANELLHRASMLASTVSAQIMSGKDPTELDTFADSNLGKFTLDYDSTKTTFDLKISELDGSVCSQLKEGGMVQKVECNETAKTASITYYKNLATTEAEGEKSPTGGTGDTKPITCPEGSSTTGTGGSTGIKIDGVLCQCDNESAVYTDKCEIRESEVCTSYNTNECGVGYFCQFAPEEFSNERGTGVCTKIQNGYLGKQSADGYWYCENWLGNDKKWDWWSANSWCIGKGRPGLISLSGLNIVKPDELGRCDFPDGDYYAENTGFDGNTLKDEKHACKTLSGVIMMPNNEYEYYCQTLRKNFSGYFAFFLKDKYDGNVHILNLMECHITNNPPSEFTYSIQPLCE